MERLPHPPERFAQLDAHLDELLEGEQRPLQGVRRTLMTRVVFGRTDSEVERNLGGEEREDLRTRGAIVGTSDEVVEQLGRLAEAGVQGVMLQWLETDDMDRLEAFAGAVLPQL